VARTADRVVTVSPPITRQLTQLRCPRRPPAVTIYNGFDDPEFAVADKETAGIADAAMDGVPGSTCASPPGPAEGGGGAPFVILYGGTFFGARTPETLFRAVAIVRKSNPEFARRARLRLHCALDARWAELARALQIQENVEAAPFVPFHEILRLQRRAHVLALVIEHGPGSEIMVTQKVFEYLASGRPIWCLAPQGACRELLEGMPGAWLCPPENPEEAARALDALFSRWMRGEPLDGAPPDRIRPFHRREQAHALARELDAMISK